MKELKSTFDKSLFEKYGTKGYFHTLEQQLEISKIESRVVFQLDWLAQLLGWNGKNYWGRLAQTADEKRKLLVGSFGFYNGYVYPEIVEVRSWENKIIVKDNLSFFSGQEIFIGDETLSILSIKKVGEVIELIFPEVTDKALENLSSGLQIKLIDPRKIPPPFLRPDIGTSGDFQFHVREEDTGGITLFPLGDTGERVPFLVNSFFSGSRYWFDKPVQVEIGNYVLNPAYDFEKSLWKIDILPDSSGEVLPLEGKVLVGDGQLDVRIKKWEDPSDWIYSGALDNFKGVWGDKGGKLPLHFCFDALSLHGFNEEISVRLEPFIRTVPFNDLLEYVYNQRASISPSPPDFRSDQVWWNSENGTFSLHMDESLNCGPWAEILYPDTPVTGPFRDYVFPDSDSFLSYPDQIPKGTLVEVLDISGLNGQSGIKGLKGELVGSGGILLYRVEDRGFWDIYEITLDDLESFENNCQTLPPRVTVRLRNSSGMTPGGPSENYEISNLSFTIIEEQTLLLRKSEDEGKWYISPPSNLKYIGNTRLFRGEDVDKPLHGEMNWDFSNPNPNVRDARLFYYNRWEDNGDGWELAGDWISVKENSELNPNFDPQTLNFGAVRVYCDDSFLEEGVTRKEYDYQLSYHVEQLTGNFIFNYIPVTYKGSVNFPKITISDSVTGVFRYDVTDSIFSGLAFRITPNVEDSETLLRVWKKNSLQVSDFPGDLDNLRFLNPLRADTNDGPSDSDLVRYHIRLPPMYVREGVEWQKVSLICQNFGYWGTPMVRGDRGCPPSGQTPRLYEEVSVEAVPIKGGSLIYSEPYLYSNVDYSYYGGEDYDNSDILPGFDTLFDDFLEADLEEYSPLNERGVVLSSSLDQGFGEWEGNYYNLSECGELSGFLANDILSEKIQPVIPPVWDSSIYKFPPHCRVGRESGKTYSNNYVLGYAFFTADISAAGEPVFNFQKT